MRADNKILRFVRHRAREIYVISFCDWFTHPGVENTALAERALLKLEGASWFLIHICFVVPLSMIVEAAVTIERILGRNAVCSSLRDRCS